MATTTCATTNSAGSASYEKVDAAARAANAAVHRASDALRPAVDALAAGAHEAVDRVASAATQAAAALDTKGEQLREAPSRMATACRRQLREHPLTTIGIAVAAGLVLDWLLSRR